MKLHLKPYWIFVTVSIPQILIFCVFYKLFSIIGTRLEEGSIKAWWMFGISLGVLCAASLVYGIVSLIAKKPVRHYYAAALLVSNIAFLYLYLIKADSVIPWSIPRWMLFDVEPVIYVLTLVMPSLAYAMLLLVLHYTPGDKEYAIWREVVITVSIPLAWYILINVAIPLMRNSLFDISPHVFSVLFIASSVCFLFMITRLVFLLLSRKPKIWAYVRLPIIIVFPLLGLLINNGAVGLLRSPASFGDFSHIGFYILAVFSGALLLVPAIENPKVRLVLFFWKSAAAVYIFYFFIVFLPYLPVAIFAIIAAGLGFLMLTPLVLMLIYVKDLWSEYQYLRGFYSRYLPVLVFVLGLSILPAAITYTYSQDKANLNRALDYVYQPDYNEELRGGIRLKGIRHALDNIKANKDDSRMSRLVSSDRLPYLSSYYNWLVLENLSLSDKKIEKLERIFFGEAESKNLVNQANQPLEKEVRIKDLKVETVFDPKDRSYKSWVHFELENLTDSQKEYVTEFVLPAGCWISNYYLDVGSVRKYGLLVDKRAATWTYQQILNERRDPGILYYLSGNRVAFRVFPFSEYETRKTGFELVHKEPLKLTIDGNEIGPENGDVVPDAAGTVTELNDSVVYVSAKEKLQLPKVKREPFYYFVVDFSKGNEGKTDGYLDRVSKFIDGNGIRMQDVQVIAANYKKLGTPPQGSWKNELKKHSVEGGLFLERHIKAILANNYIAKSDKYPAVVIVTDNIQNAVMPEDFSDFEFALPDADMYYSLNDDGKLTGYPLLKKQKYESVNASDENKAGITAEQIEAAQIAVKEVFAWPNARKPEAFLRDDGQGAVIVKDTSFSTGSIELNGAAWNNGLALQAMHTGLILDPSGYQKESLELITNSFRTKIMTPLTSYIVVEDEAQEKAMLEKQRQLLSSKMTLDAGEEAEMSEPSLWILILILGAVFAVKRYRIAR